MPHIVALSYLARAAVFDNKALKQNISDISECCRPQDFQPKTIETSTFGERSKGRERLEVFTQIQCFRTRLHERGSSLTGNVT